MRAGIRLTGEIAFRVIGELKGAGSRRWHKSARIAACLEPRCARQGRQSVAGPRDL